MKVLCVLGTRPEAIKFVSVVRALQVSNRFEPIVCATGQHRDMLDQVLRAFDLRVDIDLNLMTPGQSPSDVTSQVLQALGRVLKEVNPDWVLVQGDTVTAFAAAIAAYFSRTRLGHIEAGLRTGAKFAPYPEELMRRGISVFTDAHFAPTNRARANLLEEGISSERVWVTGNTGIDALHLALKLLKGGGKLRDEIDQRFAFLRPEARLVLVTAHRRESFGKAFEEICLALRDIAKQSPDIDLVYPVHLNPNVIDPVERILGPVRRVNNRWNKGGAHAPPNLHLIEPLDYFSFVYLMGRSELIITDSGGIQEEAPSIGKPLLVMRDVTERQEAVEAGCALLVGTSRRRIVLEAMELLNNRTHYDAFAHKSNVFGDGESGRKIVQILGSLS